MASSLFEENTHTANSILSKETPADTITAYSFSLVFFFLFFFLLNCCTSYMGLLQLENTTCDTQSGFMLAFLYPAGHIYLVPTAQPTWQFSQEIKPQFYREFLDLISGGNQESSRHSSFSLFKLILHSVIRIRTSSNLLQKKRMSLYATKSLL